MFIRMIKLFLILICHLQIVHTTNNSTNEDQFPRSAVISQFYSLSLLLIQEHFLNCSITLLSSEGSFASEKDQFLYELSQIHTLPITLVNIDLNQTVVVDKSFNDSVHFHPREGTVKHSESDCPLFIIEVDYLNALPQYLETIKQQMHPKPFRYAKCLFINIETLFLRSDPKPLLLMDLSLQFLPQKMEIILTQSHGKALRLLVYSFCPHCPQNNDNRLERPLVLVGGYNKLQGFRKYSEMFPSFNKNFHRAPANIMVPSVVEDLRVLFGTKWSSYDPLPVFKLMRQICKSLNMTYDTATFPAIPLGHEYNIQLHNVLGKAPLSISSSLSLDEIFHSNLIHPSVPYDYQTSVIVYRKVVPTVLRSIFSNVLGERASIAFDFLFISLCCMMVLSRRWDMFSRRRLPRPTKRNSWKFYDRKLTVSKYFDSVWRIFHIFLQQIPFPDIRLKKYSISSTIILTSMGFCGVATLWFWKLNALTNISKPIQSFRLHSLKDVVEAAILGVENEDGTKSNVQLVSTTVPAVWKYYNNVVKQNDPGGVFESTFDALLNEMTVVTSEDDCLQKVLNNSDPNIFMICLGIFKLFTQMAFYANFAKNNRKLLFEEVGAMKFTVLGYDRDFPWTDQVDRKVSTFVESGLMRYWGEFKRKYKVTGKAKVLAGLNNSSVDKRLVTAILTLCLFCMGCAFFACTIEILLGRRMIMVNGFVEVVIIAMGAGRTVKRAFGWRRG